MKFNSIFDPSDKKKKVYSIFWRPECHLQSIACNSRQAQWLVSRKASACSSLLNFNNFAVTLLLSFSQFHIFTTFLQILCFSLWDMEIVFTCDLGLILILRLWGYGSQENMFCGALMLFDEMPHCRDIFQWLDPLHRKA